MKMVPYKVVRGDNGDARWISAAKNTRRRKFRDDSDQAEGSAESYWGRRSRRRDHVPAYFNDAQRQAPRTPQDAVWK